MPKVHSRSKTTKNSPYHQDTKASQKAKCLEVVQKMMAAKGHSSKKKQQQPVKLAPMMEMPSRRKRSPKNSSVSHPSKVVTLDVSSPVAKRKSSSSTGRFSSSLCDKRDSGSNKKLCTPKTPRPAAVLPEKDRTSVLSSLLDMEDSDWSSAMRTSHSRGASAFKTSAFAPKAPAFSAAAVLPYSRRGATTAVSQHVSVLSPGGPKQVPLLCGVIDTFCSKMEGRIGRLSADIGKLLASNAKDNPSQVDEEEMATTSAILEVAAGVLPAVTVLYGDVQGLSKQKQALLEATQEQGNHDKVAKAATKSGTVAGNRTAILLGIWHSVEELWSTCDCYVRSIGKMISNLSWSPGVPEQTLKETSELLGVLREHTKKVVLLSSIWYKLAMAQYKQCGVIFEGKAARPGPPTMNLFTPCVSKGGGFPRDARLSNRPSMNSTARALSLTTAMKPIGHGRPSGPAKRPAKQNLWPQLTNVSNDRMTPVHNANYHSTTGFYPIGGQDGTGTTAALDHDEVQYVKTSLPNNYFVVPQTTSKPYATEGTNKTLFDKENGW